MSSIHVSPDVELHYTIFPSRFEPASAPWLLVMHPTFLDSTWCTTFTLDDRFRTAFNLILFDQRYHGRTKAQFRPEPDIFTLATDLAMGMQHLQLPPVHVMACTVWQGEIAMRLSILFPERVLSLALLGLCPPEDPPELRGAFQETLHSLITPEDLEEFDEAIAAIQHWCFSPNTTCDDVDLLDEWAFVLCRRFPPNLPKKMFSVVQTFLTRTPLSAGAMAYISCPTFVTHGDSELCYKREDVFSRMKEFKNVPNGPDWVPINDAPLQFLDLKAAVVRKEYLRWFKCRFNTIRNPTPPPVTDYRAVLKKIADEVGQPEIADRDPTQSNSFYATTAEQIAYNVSKLASLEQSPWDQFSMIGSNAPERWTGADWDARVPWRFSRRFDNKRCVDAPKLKGTVDIMDDEEIEHQGAISSL